MLELSDGGGYGTSVACGVVESLAWLVESSRLLPQSLVFLSPASETYSNSNILISPPPNLQPRFFKFKRIACEFFDAHALLAGLL